MPKITMRTFDQSSLTPVEKLTLAEIRAIREEAHASVTVFARHLYVTPATIKHWESGQHKPNGPALKLLALVKKKGLQCLI